MNEVNKGQMILRPAMEYCSSLEKFEGNCSERLKLALEIADEVHFGEKRKTSPYEPYISHCIAVTSILKSWGADEDEQVAGLLHDSVENHPDLIDIPKIREMFGERVAFLVEGVTKLKSKSGENSEFETLRKIARESLIDSGVARLKLADRVHNMMTMEGMKPETQIKKARETLKVYAPLALSFGMWEVRSLLQDLSFPYLDEERYNLVKQEIDTDLRLRGEFIVETEGVIEEKLREVGLEALVGHVIGGYFEVAEKIKKRKCDIKEVNEVISFRVILSDIDSCYQAMTVMRSRILGSLLANKHVDYLRVSAVNGYSALEDVYEFEEGRIEICFTTREKEKFNKWGFDERINRKVVFTPKEELVFLKPDATGYDLVNKLETVLGKKASAIEIDGTVCDLATVIPNASLVEIL